MVPIEEQVIVRVHALQRMFEMEFRLSTEASVKCVVYKEGELMPGTATVTLERGVTTVVIKGVPARVCGNCGEQYVDERTSQAVMNLAEGAARSGVQLEIREFAAA